MQANTPISIPVSLARHPSAGSRYDPFPTARAFGTVFPVPVQPVARPGQHHGFVATYGASITTGLSDILCLRPVSVTG